jgi:1-acyl-sn-glycerol-3-phosphate acyltransferase
MIRLFKLLMFSMATIFFLFFALCINLFCVLVGKDLQRLLTVASTRWAKTILWILKISVLVEGQEHFQNDTPYFIVSNHQSYLDVIIIASVFPTIFVAKKDVQSWPILGWLASLGGTLFIDRKAFRGTVQSISLIEKALRKRINVLVFPEGTSNNGELIFPFKSSLFNAALATQCNVLPLSLNYKMINNSPVVRSNRDIVCWYGDMTFTDHFWNVLNVRSVEVLLDIHHQISIGEKQSAKDISQTAYDVVNAGFHNVA